ncbi:(2,3-dihydroxybenzoyl)adenylate synthase [Kribbella speibonae]|uniref:2,3-dihydroxybenzoate-AMP ligase n=1 Tax=Kribbella speibonae TaxID=1572660 RepID=A0A4R0IDM0_9ACTN|nr:AMP-binding protein [Kribbella speibonae]TCC28888.1 2,3-dihydroxybenzoate-AMP ligase [Kribbella speibonae]
MVSPIADGTTPWPAEDVERYVAAGYWEGRSLPSHIWEQAERTPDKVALVDGDLRLTYAELTARADSAATALTNLGLRADDRIVVQLPNGWEFVVLTLACLRAGVVPVMALPGHRYHELSYLAAHAEAAAIAVPDVLRGFDHQELAHRLKDEVESLDHVLVVGEEVTKGSVDLRALCSGADAWRGPEPDSRSVAVFLLSGGTTGLPKLIARTHDDYTYNAKRSGTVSGMDASTVYLVALPAGHNFPLACPGLLGALLVGGTVVMLPSPEPVRTFATIAAEEVTHTAVVPAVAQRWLDEYTGQDLSSLKVLQVGGARLADEVARKIRPVLGCTLQQVFGMAEGLLNYTRLDDPEDVICTTQGRPMCPDDEIQVVDPFDRPVPPGEPGSLLTRGPYTPRGYYKAEQQNARAFTPDGWYRSGDICRIVAGGNLVVEGRDKDMINRGGEKISAEEVENLTYTLPGVQQVAAVAMPDPSLGERVCVYVVPRGATDITLDDVRQAMADLGVAPYKFPERLVLIPELPTTKVGKIDKVALRADIANRMAN